ncbi:sugar transporter SWEET1-like isoform X1 [Uloborus diversus]|uniref:sugar transporter SWEET1-like isoform X1 n=1 Tax=Uloborus diversus TaxID=327109 RepID=UPI00240A6013|nr:sugar transporter SWEET1-like isoform X1 [Uloborus diversus]XP_054716293.1 sugar transporter SWEET1-like isoform X2 [Uloborus diversus]XP_054716294.1 sugar transporter SWEET1-like isoform X1 [Uloborus diversus]XP_054716295.1 sugar transporter SWEET1-like isoform X1 [Uloborus diversus]
MDLKNLVGQAATVCTIAVFLSGTEICRKIYAKKSTNDISALPIVCGLVSCSLWLRYGILISDSALMIVNATGVTLQSLYTLWYARFASNKGIFYRQVFFAVFVIGLLYYLTTYTVLQENARSISGIAACSAGVLFMGSPLAAVAHILRTKNTDSLPLAMIVTTFVMATLWFYYGILTDDKFVQIPNFLGALLALSQLCLFAIFPKKKPYYELPTV